ncbi:MAG TPA: energy transducer TonB [Blastocatellia bacterium]|nr:energy transducer TonB [Blastocatellia bacterium]
MKVCPRCSQSFADGFTFCPKDAERLKKYDLRARVQREDEFRFLIEPESLPRRLKRELVNAFGELRVNPRDYLRGLIRGEGTTRQRKRLLQAGLAIAMIVYASVLMTTFLLRLSMSERQVTAAPKPKREPDGDWKFVPLSVELKTERAKEAAKSNAGLLGGSVRRPKPDRANGGGGQEGKLPARKGEMPTPTMIPQINPPDLKPPKLNPSLIVPETILADDAFRRRITEDFGLRNGVPEAPSLGNNKGTGVGPGNGPGYNKGDRGNLGGGSLKLGSGPTDGTGDEPIVYSKLAQPTILYREKAKYTEEARQNRVQGTVMLTVVFGADGRVRDIRTIRGLPHGLTETSIEAAQKIRFQPAIQNGKPISVRAILEYNFALY